MNAAPRSVLPQRRSQRLATNPRVTRSKAALSSTVTSLPSSKMAGQNADPNRFATATLSQRQTPVWLRSLLLLQRSSDLITFLLVATTLTIYSWTVYTQQQWAKAYRELETLQRHERHLTTANEVFKDQLAQQAESPATGLVKPTHANTIVLKPAPQRQSYTAPTQTADAKPTATAPLGY